MPYFITVLALVVIGVGFTLFQSDSRVAETTTEPTPIEVIEETVQGFIATNTPAVGTSEIEEIPPVKEETKVTVKETETPAVTTTPSPIPTPTPTPVAHTDFTNGTYSTQTSYRTPDGIYTMNVSMTIANDKVTNTSLSFDTDGARDGYSKRFSSAYQSQIIGQDLGSVSLSRVGGASLTTRAFNTAINTIRTQASA